MKKQMNAIDLHARKPGDVDSKVDDPQLTPATEPVSPPR
jgi:hypothetical protein